MITLEKPKSLLFTIWLIPPANDNGSTIFLWNFTVCCKCQLLSQSVLPRLLLHYHLIWFSLCICLFFLSFLSFFLFWFLLRSCLLFLYPWHLIIDDKTIWGTLYSCTHVQMPTFSFVCVCVLCVCVRYWLLTCRNVIVSFPSARNVAIFKPVVPPKDCTAYVDIVLFRLISLFHVVLPWMERIRLHGYYCLPTRYYTFRF